MNTVHSENVMTRRSYWLQRAKLQARRQREYRESNKAREGEAYVIIIRELERLRKYNGLRTQRQRYEKALKRGRTEIKRESPVNGTCKDRM